jgi:hypothetical protein
VAVHWVGRALNIGRINVTIQMKIVQGGQNERQLRKQCGRGDDTCIYDEDEEGEKSKN